MADGEGRRRGFVLRTHLVRLTRNSQRQIHGLTPKMSELYSLGLHVGTTRFEFELASIHRSRSTSLSRTLRPTRRVGSLPTRIASHNVVFPRPYMRTAVWTLMVLTVNSGSGLPPTGDRFFNLNLLWILNSARCQDCPLASAA
jgi:hypothetical protein